MDVTTMQSVLKDIKGDTKDQPESFTPHFNNNLFNMTEENDIKDIVIPSIVIVALFIINSIVLFIIYRYKKKKQLEYTEEELGTLPVTNAKDNLFI